MGGQETYPTIKQVLALERTAHGVVKVKLFFDNVTSIINVNEIQILGFIQPGVQFNVSTPEILLSEHVMLIHAHYAFKQWSKRWIGDGRNDSKFSETQKAFVYTYFKGAMELVRFSVDKDTGRVTVQELADLVSVKPSDPVWE